MAPLRPRVRPCPLRPPGDRLPRLHRVHRVHRAHRVHGGILAAALAAGLSAGPARPGPAAHAADGAGARDAPAEAGGRATLWTLHHGLLGAERLELELRTAHAARLAPAARSLLARVEARLGLPGVLRDDAGPGQRSAARLVAGDLADPQLQALLAPLGARPLAGGGLELLGLRLGGASDGGDALVATFEDPERAGRPLTLALADGAAGLGALLEELEPVARPGLEVWTAGELALRVALDPGGSPVTDVEQGAERFDLARAAHAATARRVEGDGLVLVLPAAGARGSGIDRHALAARAPRLAEAVARVARWLDAPVAPPLTVELHATPADLARVSGRVAHHLVVPGGPGGARVHVVAADEPGRLEAAAAHATARALLATPRLPWLPEALGTAAAERFRGRPLAEWVGRLVAGGFALAPAELCDSLAAERWSPLRLAPLRAALALFLAEREDGARLLAGAASGALDLAARPELASGFERWLAGWARPPEPGADAVRRAAILAAPPRRGVALVAGGPPDAPGLLAPEADEALARVAELGADAFTVTARASFAPVAPRFAAWPRPLPGGMEEDVALEHALAAGRARGLRPTLVLQVLATPWSARADGVTLGSPEAVAGFFARYATLARHYAFLAELAGVEVLCVGDDLRNIAHTTWEEGAPHEALRRARLAGWRALLPELRGAFGGALAYDASTPLAAGKVGFWNELDLLGLDLFPRFPGRTAAPPERALVLAFQRGLEDAAELAREQGLPLLVLQTGFPSSSLGWHDARVPYGPVDLELQRRALRALATALAALDEAPSGLFLWSWPVDPAAGGPDDPGHALRGKPAEEELAALFSDRGSR